MAKLVYSAIASLDGYVADEDGGFRWCAPDEEVHSFINEQERPVGTYLYGRRLYEVMKVWEDPAMSEGEGASQDFAEIWRAADKVVYSRTLERAETPRTRIEHELDPAAVELMKESAAGDISIGGAELAGQALAAGLVDECHLFLSPVLVGGGKPALPAGVRLDLELIDEHRFTGGVVHLHHRVRR
jgi:dihydrofolate reductase